VEYEINPEKSREYKPSEVYKPGETIYHPGKNQEERRGKRTGRSAFSKTGLEKAFGQPEGF